MTEICCVILDIITPHVIKILNVHDRDLQLLAEKIPSLIVRERQPNTCSSYTTYFTKWKKWAASFREVKDLPAKEIYISIYLVRFITFSERIPCY